MDALSERIRARREALDLTQETLALRVGVSIQAVQAWEYGKAQPRPRTMAKLCAALGVSEGELRGLVPAADQVRPSIDVERLELVSEQLQAAMDEFGIDLSPRQRARLLALLYEEQDWVTGDRLSNLLRLVS